MITFDEKKKIYCVVRTSVNLFREVSHIERIFDTFAEAAKYRDKANFEAETYKWLYGTKIEDVFYHVAEREIAL